MKCKGALIIVLVSSILLLATRDAVAESTSSGTWTVYDLTYGGLEIKIEAPCQVNPGENITVTIRGRAYGADIDVDYVYVDIYGLKNETYAILLKTITYLQGYKLTSHEVSKEYNVTIPDDVSTGLTYGVIQCEWRLQNAPEMIPSSGFILTYVKSTELEQLQAEYDELMANYTSLLANYTELDSKYGGELGGARNLMYVFVATTIIAVATVLFLIIRRPKTFWS